MFKVFLGLETNFWQNRQHTQWKKSYSASRTSKLNIYLQEVKPDLYFLPCTKINLRGVNFNLKHGILKLMDVNIEIALWDTEVVKKFWSRAPIAQELAPHSRRWDCIKTGGTWTARESVGRASRQPQNGRKPLPVILLVGANIRNLQWVNIQNLQGTREVK